MPAPAHSPFHQIDKQRFNRFHTLALFTTGMGVFTDGYDLSSIGIVLALALHSFGVDHLAGIESSLMTGSALAGAAVGALLFGCLAGWPTRGASAFMDWTSPCWPSPRSHRPSCPRWPG